MGEKWWNCEEDVCVCVYVCDVWDGFGGFVKRKCVCDVWGRVGGIVKRMCVCVCVMCGGELVEL